MSILSPSKEELRGKMLHTNIANTTPLILTYREVNKLFIPTLRKIITHGESVTKYYVITEIRT